MGNSIPDEYLVELTKTTALSKSTQHRVSELELDVKEIRKDYALMYEMNKNMAVIAEQTNSTREDVKGIKTDVETLKKEKICKGEAEEVAIKTATKVPLKLLYKVTEYVIIGVVAVILAKILEFFK